MTLSKIDKKFDKECPTHISLGKGSFVILRSEVENIKIKSFYAREILSLIEEIGERIINSGIGLRGNQNPIEEQRATLEKILEDYKLPKQG